MAVEKEKLQWMYKNMLTIRNFEGGGLFAAGKCYYVGEEA